MKELGRAVRELRETAGLAREQLAAAAGISEAFLIKIEQDKRGMSPATLVRIAGVLGVDVDELVTRAALLEASNATSAQDRDRATLKAAAANPAIMAGIGWLAFGSVGAVTAAAAAIMVRRAKSRETTELPASASEARQFLIDQIMAMPDEQVVEVVRLANDIKNNAAATAPKMYGYSALGAEPTV